MVSLLKKFKRQSSQKRANKFASYIAPFVQDGEKVLDFGCGSLQIAEQLLLAHDIQIHGIDVLPSPNKSIPFTLYNGQQIPFADNHFDVTYASFVFHHIPNPEMLLAECFRVSRKRLIILEDVYHHNYQKLLNKVFDYGNKFSVWDMNMALNFKHEQEWIYLLTNGPTHQVESIPITPYLWKPTVHRQFVVELLKSPQA